MPPKGRYRRRIRKRLVAGYPADRHTDGRTPECGIAALAAGTPVSCRFCYRGRPDGETAAADYVWAAMVRNVA